jgi:hypothetical protein
MAFKNSVKATLLEPEQPRARSDEPRATVEESAPALPVAQPPSENTAQRPSENATKQAAVTKPAGPVAQRPLENVAQRPPENVAPRPSENENNENTALRASAHAAKPSPVAKAPAAPTPVKHDASRAAAWHARAEQLCAMADTLPCATSWSLISKIAVLYDELARDAGWTVPGALAADNACLEEPPADDELQMKEEPQALAPPAAEPPQAEPPQAERAAFSRRPLPIGRRFPRRRA